MKVTIKATNIEHTPAIDAYVQKRVDSFRKFIAKDDQSVLCQVEVGKTTHHHKQGDVFRAEVNMHIAGKDLYAESVQEDLYAAIDDVTEEIKRSIKSHKTKQTTLMKRGGAMIKNLLRFGRQ